VRLGSERILPVLAAIVVLAATFVSFQPVAARPIGDVAGNGSAVRLAVGGLSDPGAAGTSGLARVPADGVRDPSSQVDAGIAPGQTFTDDGTVYKPVAVDTTVADGSSLLQTYTVKAGDTLTGIASHYGVSMMTIWWANKLTAKDQLHVGQELIIPPVSGLVVTVKVGDTLESLAAQYQVEPSQIIEVNQLQDPTLIVGQTLILPDAVGAAIPTPRPVRGAAVIRNGTACNNCSAPSSYSGGKFRWPVVGGNNYISQYFHYGHYAIDIAADYGSRVVAAAAGTVTFAGWMNNGGGYQVWVAHGSDLYTTYNHMSAITVSAGESVDAGQQVGNVGQSGHATGPHCHFAVWIGAIFNGGYPVNPLRYF
jgi:murein DD-endopeptidase MepM/ murein hydrolase activator NlpD